MSKQNKDRLEEFFSKATQNYDFEYREEDWKKLESKLNEVDKGGAVPYWKANGRKFLFAGLVLLVSLISLFFIVDVDNPFENKDVVKAKSNLNEKEISTSQKANINDMPITENEEKKSSNTTAESIKQDNSTHGISQNNSSDDIVFSQSEKAGSQREVQKHYLSDDNSDMENSIPNGGNYLSNNREDKDFLPGYGNSGRESVLIPYLNPVGLTINEYKFNKPQWENIPDQEEEKEPIVVDNENEEAFVSNIALAFTVAPDFSSVGIGNFTKPGTRIGGILSYNFHRRWSFRAGAIMTHNIYKARGDQYNSPADWYNNVAPISASGNCNILDIPVSVRYNYLLRENNTFYISAGANTYVMLKEEYDFEYAYQQPYYMDSWESDEVTKHLFGLINISAGWEHHLAPRWSFQAEPFVNVPVSGIGWGEVDLFTFGSYFSLKYKMFRSRK